MEKSDFKILRKNRISFEMQHKTGDQYVVLYRSSLFYQDDFFIQGKNPITKNIDMDSLQAIAQYYYNKTLIEDFSTATRPFYFSRSKENLSFVDAAFNDIKKATNPDYISNYCFILLAEIASMKKTNQVKYFQALIPFLSNLNNGLNNEHEKLLTNFYQYSSLSDNIKKESLLAIAKSNYNFERGSYCYKQIVNMLCDFVDQKREDLRGALDKYSVFSSESSRADFLLEKYDGLGIIKKDLPLLLLARGKSEKLFSLVRNNPSCFLDYFQESGKAIELVRYLSLHGYHGCIKEMAQNLLPYIRHAKDYYALRVFLTDDEVLQIFKKLDETAKEKIDYLAFAYYDKESLTQQIKFRSYYYSYKQVRTLCYTYGYAPFIKDIDEYTSKEVRKQIRDEMSYRSFDEIYTYSIGLIEAGDKISFKYYFTPEAEERYLHNPYFCLTKAYLGLKQQKKIKDMYSYKEAK